MASRTTMKDVELLMNEVREQISNAEKTNTQGYVALEKDTGHLKQMVYSLLGYAAALLIALWVVFSYLDTKLDNASGQMNERIDNVLGKQIENNMKLIDENRKLLLQQQLDLKSNQDRKKQR